VCVEVLELPGNIDAYTVTLRSTLLSQLSVGTSLHLTGKLVSSPGRGQDRELHINKDDAGLKNLGVADPTVRFHKPGFFPSDAYYYSKAYPIPPHPLTNEYLRDRLHLRSRTSFMGAVMRTRSALTRGLASYYEVSIIVMVYILE
jgi:asparaginyl-tRNA synthetase